MGSIASLTCSVSPTVILDRILEACKTITVREIFSFCNLHLWEPKESISKFVTRLLFQLCTPLCLILFKSVLCPPTVWTYFYLVIWSRHINCWVLSLWGSASEPSFRLSAKYLFAKLSIFSKVQLSGILLISVHSVDIMHCGNNFTIHIRMGSHLHFWTLFVRVGGLLYRFICIIIVLLSSTIDALVICCSRGPSASRSRVCDTTSSTLAKDYHLLLHLLWPQYL